MLEEKKS